MKIISHFCLAILFASITLSCNTGAKEEITLDTENYSLTLKADAYQKNADRSASIGVGKITVQNTTLIDVMATLLDKPKALVNFTDDDPTMMITGSYQNKRNNPTQQQSKQDVLAALKNYLNISIAEAPLPEHYYYLEAQDSTVTHRHLTTATQEMSKSKIINNRIEFTTANLKDICNTLNKVYGNDLQFLTTDTALTSRYTFVMDNIPAKQALDYLMLGIGMKVVSPDSIEDAATLSMITSTAKN